jgi:hypothetical protein
MFMPQPAWTHVAGMVVVCHHTQLLLVEVEFCELFAWAGLEPQSF